MTKRFAFVLATALALAAVPQVARACTGDACAGFQYIPNLVDGYAISNPDKVRKIHIVGCFLDVKNACLPSSNFDFTIEPNSHKDIKAPATHPYAKPDVKTATFSGLSVTIHNSAKEAISINIKAFDDYREDLKSGETKSVPARNLSGVDPSDTSVPWEARLRDLKSVTQPKPNPVCAHGVVAFKGAAARIDVTKCG
jgi:hypothetical protein